MGCGLFLFVLFLAATFLCRLRKSAGGVVIFRAGNHIQPGSGLDCVHMDQFLAIKIDGASDAFHASIVGLLQNGRQVMGVNVVDRDFSSPRGR